MQYFELIIDPIVNLTEKDKWQFAQFLTIDLKYAYDHFKNHSERSRHCLFNINWGESQSTHCFKSAFYGLTDMPAKIKNHRLHSDRFMNKILFSGC